MTGLCDHGWPRCCHEFEIELDNTYPPGAGHEDTVLQQWDGDDGYARVMASTSDPAAPVGR